jgi:hypothetical protein
MQTKPYNLQAPEDIAKEYGGNKQKIAKAAQMGLLDPTAAVLAGMFIDRMRGAQEQEQVPQQTVAQQTFAPTPPAPAPAPAPMQGPQQALGATPQAPQMAAMQQQMAPRPGVRGMDRIPVNPDMMPSAAGGGLVAFVNPQTLAQRQLAERKRARQALIDPYAPVMPDAPQLRGTDFDLGASTQDYLAALQGMMPEGSPRDEMMAYYSPEEVTKRGEALTTRAKERAGEDLWTAIALGGLQGLSEGKASTGSTFGDIAQALGGAGATAMPYILEGRKAQRAAEDKATAMQEESMAKRLELAVADREEKIALLTPAFNAATGAQKAALEKELAQYNADIQLYKAQLDDVNAYRRGRKEAEERRQLQTQQDEAAMARTEAQLKGQPPAVEIQRRDAIYADEINRRTAEKGSALTQEEKDATLRFAAEQAAIGTTFALQDMKDQQAALVKARTYIEEETSPKAIREAAFANPQGRKLLTAMEKNPNDERAKADYEEWVAAYKYAIAKQASLNNNVPMSNLGYGASIDQSQPTDTEDFDLGSAAEAAGGKLR